MSAELVTMQAKRRELADLAMSIFVKDPPNDPKKLLETRKQSSLRHAGPGSPPNRKSLKHEVCYQWLQSSRMCVGKQTKVQLKSAFL